MKRFLVIIISLLASFSGFKSFSQGNTTKNWNFGRGYAPFAHATADGILLENLSDSLLFDYLPIEGASANFRLSFRAQNINSNPHKKYTYINGKGERRNVRFPHWGLIITSPADTILVKIQPGEKETGAESIAATFIEILSEATGIKHNVAVGESLNPYDKDNLWCIENSPEGIIIRGGNKEIKEIITLPTSLNKITGFGFFAGWGAKTKISDIKLTYEPDNGNVFNLENAQLDKYFKKSKDSMEGYWAIYDRNMEESLVKLGGNYILACLKNGDNYDFYYIDGATVNKENWNHGDLKIRLTPTPFKGIYTVVWLDSMKKPISFDIKAEEGEGNTLTFQFPYQDSVIRFRKPDP